MEYEITTERRAYLDARGLIVLSACPGSGKTTSIVKKLFAVSCYCKEQYGKHTGFACLSFTNKACGELQDKYNEMHGESLKYPNVVSTIDSFIMQNVVLPFWYLCPYCESKPIVVNEEQVLRKIYENHIVIYGKEQIYPAMVFRDYGRLFYSVQPEKVVREANGFTFNKKSIADPNQLAYCKEVFKYRLKRGYITSQDALWMGFYILKEYAFVARTLVNRFPYVIVDEAQDNSELQFYFFDLLKKSGLKNLEYVGDICQSIYDFRNARPDLLQKIMETSEWNILHFTECRRSNQRIINLYSKLKPVDIPIIKAFNVDDVGIPIVVYRYNEGNVKDVINHFNKTCSDKALNKKNILARGDRTCRKLTGVKDLDFKYWMSYIPYAIIDAKQAFNTDDMNKAFSKIRIVLADLKFKSSEYKEKKDFIRDIEHDIEYNVKMIKFLKRVPDFSLSFAEWTLQSQLLLKSFWELTTEPNFHVYKQKPGYKMSQMASKTLEQYYTASEKNSEYHRGVNTIHAVKGASVDAVLLFLSDSSKGQNISLNDFPDIPVTIMNEKQRMIYVACSRAKQFLAIAVPTSVKNENISRALKNVTYELKELGLQGELFR